MSNFGRFSSTFVDAALAADFVVSNPGDLTASGDAVFIYCPKLGDLETSTAFGDFSGGYEIG